MKRQNVVTNRDRLLVQIFDQAEEHLNGKTNEVQRGYSEAG